MQTEDVAKMFFECVLVVNELEQLRSCKRSTDPLGHGGPQGIKAVLAVTYVFNIIKQSNRDHQ